MWTRRAFLRAGGLAMVAFGTGGGPSFLGRAALAAEGGRAGRRPVLVALFLRGAMDGLAAVPPLAGELGGARLARLRPRLTAAARPGGDGAPLELGNGFGLHPALAPLAPWWRDGRLAIVHAVGSPDPTRSHFDAQDYMESGTPGVKSTASGWLNRVVGRSGHEPGPVAALAAASRLPRSLAGPAPALAIADLERFRLGGARGGAAAGERASAAFEALWSHGGDDLLAARGGDAFEAARLLSPESLASYRPAAGARYPRSPLGDALAQIALLIKGEVGLEIAFAESGGWDTHVGQGAERGSFARRAADLAAAVAAFWTDLGPRREHVVLLTMTEFGRTVAENGSAGTDHGHGSCLFVLGERLAGGRVHGRWPGLAEGDLFEGRDLAVTTDFRAVFAGVAAGHLGVRDATGLFPGWRGEGLRLVAG